MTPPTQNPIKWHTQARRHWADAQEIKPGVFAVLEGSGPEAQRRDYAIVRLGAGGWVLLGRVTRPRYGWIEMSFATNNGRTWKQFAPDTCSGELIAFINQLAKDHA